MPILFDILLHICFKCSLQFSLLSITIPRIFFIIYSIYFCPIYVDFIMFGSYAVSIATGHCVCFFMFNESLFVLSHIVSFFNSMFK